MWTNVYAHIRTLSTRYVREYACVWAWLAAVMWCVNVGVVLPAHAEAASKAANGGRVATTQNVDAALWGQPADDTAHAETRSRASGTAHAETRSRASGTAPVQALPADMSSEVSRHSPRWQRRIDGSPQRAVFRFSRFHNVMQKAELPHSYLFLPDETPSSRSIGMVSHGYLVHPKQLPVDGGDWAILTRQRARGLNWGSDALIELIEDAAHGVARQFPESVLWVGNIGRRFGGPIHYSISHQIGHDVDLSFYVTDPEGNPVAPPDLLHFQDDGTSVAYNGYYRFDVERTWALVAALIRSDAASLQYLFISNGLRRLLIRYAISQHADSQTLHKAKTLLRQPAPYIPHNNHLHVRIYCTPQDLASGCRNVGAKHAWMPKRDKNVRAGTAHAATFLDDPSPDVRAAAIMRLGLLDAHRFRDRIRAHLDDPSPRVRQQTAAALVRIAPDDAPGWIAAQLAQETDASTIVAFFHALEKLPGDPSAQALVAWLSDVNNAVLQQCIYPTVKGAPLRLHAVDALGHTDSLEALAMLARLLAHPVLRIRARASRAFAMVANHRPTDFDWTSTSGDTAARAAAYAQWMAWVKQARSQHKTRLDLALAGMREAGYSTPSRARSLAASLAQAAGDPRPYIRVNAQRMLMRMTGKKIPSLRWPAQDARAYWTRWVERHSWRIAALR